MGNGSVMWNLCIMGFSDGLSGMVAGIWDSHYHSSGISHFDYDSEDSSSAIGLLYDLLYYDLSGWYFADDFLGNRSCADENSGDFMRYGVHFDSGGTDYFPGT